MTLVPLVLDLFDGALNPVAAGTASLAPSVQLTDPGTGIAVESGPTVTFRPSNPVPLTWIIPTDASGWAPSGWGWDIAFSGVPGNPQGYSFKITSSGYLYSFTATSASPAVFTASGSSLTNGTAIALAPGSSLPGGFRSGQAYYVVDASGDTFSLAASVDASALASTSAGSGTAGVVQYLSSLSPQSSVVTSVAYAQVNAGDLDGPGGSSASPKVSGIQGVPVSSTAPVTGEVLTYDGSEYVPEAGGGGSGTVTSVAVESANGLAGTVADSTTTPQITLETTVTGLLKGAGGAVEEAAAGTDYLAPGGSGSGLTGITAAQVGADASGAATTAQSNAEAYAAGLQPTSGSPLSRSAGGTGLSETTAAALVAALGALLAANNLSDLVSAATARANLGLGLVTLTDAATIAVNAAAGSVFRVTLGGSRILGTPSNPVDGQQVIFEVIQGTGGNFTLAYSAAYAFPASIPTPALSSTAGQRDYLSFIYDGLESLWQCTGFVPNQNAGIVPVSMGGSGQSTQAAAITALTGTQTSGYVLRSNGTNAVLAPIQAGDVPTLNQSTSGTAAGLSATLVPGSGGTGQTTLQAALNALAGAVTSGEFLRANGTNVLLAAIQAGDLPAGTTSAQGALQLDGTGGDIQPAGQAAAAGSKGQPADAKHIHPPGSSFLCTPSQYAPGSQTLLAVASTTMGTFGLTTTVAAGSNGGEISAIASWSSPSAGVLDVASTSGFPSSGTLLVATSTTTATITYAGTSGGNQFTGCAYVSGSATGTVATAGSVTLSGGASAISTGSFTAPASGDVIVTASFAAIFSTTSLNAAVGLAAHSTVTPVVGNLVIFEDTAASISRPYVIQFLVTGLTPGNSYNFDLLGAISAGFMTILAIGQSTTTPTLTAAAHGAPATMTVQAV